MHLMFFRLSFWFSVTFLGDVITSYPGQVQTLLSEQCLLAQIGQKVSKGHLSFHFHTKISAPGRNISLVTRTCNLCWSMFLNGIRMNLHSSLHAMLRTSTLIYSLPLLAEPCLWEWFPMVSSFAANKWLRVKTPSGGFLDWIHQEVGPQFWEKNIICLQIMFYMASLPAIPINKHVVKIN